MAGGYSTFGSYILFKEYTEDVFGHLYRAGELDRGGIGRAVFLRVFDGQHVPTDEVIDAFPAAREIAARLTATNIAAGATLIRHGEVPALAWDYQPSQPLSSTISRIRAEGFPMAVDNALLVVEKLASALAAALAFEYDGSPVVHGCVHPDLAMISNDGESLLTGFGVAEPLLGLLDRPEVADRLTPYLAPEVLLTRTASKRGDVYSLGSLLVELLSGEVMPADPAGRLDTLDRMKVAHDDQPVPEDIKALLGRAIAARPDGRFSSAADLKKELDRLLYGGAYSPTTFNLALFIDRLFRSEIQVEEQHRTSEEALDLTPYLAPEPIAEDRQKDDAIKVRRGRSGLWFGSAAATVAAAAIAIWWTLTSRQPPQPTIPPTPTAEEAAARQREEQQRLKEMVEELVQQKMSEKEDEIREELRLRQERIEELQRRLRESEARAARGQPSAQEQRQQQELQRQIAAEEEARREREARLEEERGSATGAPASQTVVTGPPDLVATEAPKPATPEPMASPTPLPTPRPTPTETVIVENSFFDPSEVDTLPAVEKEYPVTWPRLALHSRRRGVVIVQVTVNAEGRATEVKVLRADHQGFGIPQAVIEAVQKYRFRPATKSGVLVSSYVTVTKRYQFQGR